MKSDWWKTVLWSAAFPRPRDEAEGVATPGVPFLPFFPQLKNLKSQYGKITKDTKTEEIARKEKYRVRSEK